MTPTLLIESARACLGTRFRHQGRSPAHGLDCVGLIVVAARAIGLPIVDVHGYGRQPSARQLEAHLAKNALVPVDVPKLCTVALFDFGHGGQHVALLTQRGMIHAYAPARKVIEHRFDDSWRAKLLSLHAFPHFL